jgi:RimJ/RimL family protein N-acetyltransferase
MKNYLIETNRLIVHKLSLDDAELLFKYSQEEITKKELPDEVFETIEKTKIAIKYFMINYDYEINFSFPLVYGIFSKQDGCIIGHLGLSEIDRGIEIGYAIATDYQNKGYASELITPFINWSKKYLNVDKIYGIVKKKNIASWKILEKNDFLLLEEGIYNNYFEGKYLTKIYVK